MNSSLTDIRARREEVTEKKKIMLDKLKQKVYNTLVVTEGKEPSVYAFEEPPLEFSKDKELSTRIFRNIEEYLNRAQEACLKEGYPQPIISGGCIRDAMFGVVPKDYDIFVNVTGVEDDELNLEDRFHLLVDQMLPESEGWSYSREDKEQYRKMPDHFIVYTCRRVGAEVQVIGRHDPLVSSENPLDFTNDYPYNVIKNVAFEDRIVVHPQAIHGFKTKTIQAFDGGYDKASSWFMRHHGNRYNIDTQRFEKSLWELKRSPADKKKFEESVEGFKDVVSEVIYGAVSTSAGTPKYVDYINRINRRGPATAIHNPLREWVERDVREEWVGLPR